MCSAYSADGGVLRTEFPSCLLYVSQLSIDNWVEFPNKVLGFSTRGSAETASLKETCGEP